MGMPTRCIFSIRLSRHLVTDHKLRPSAHPHRITEHNCHIISRPAQNLNQPQEGWLDRIQAGDRTQTELPSCSNWLPETPEDPSRCYAQRPRPSRQLSYPLSTNLKINTPSDPDTRLHLPSSNSQQTTRQASTSETTSPYSVCGYRLNSCLWYSVSRSTDIQNCRIVPAPWHHSMAVLLP